MICIGVSGRIHNGKDAIAERLVKRWGFTVVRFSEQLKQEVWERMPLLIRYLHDVLPHDQYHLLTCLHDSGGREGFEDCARRMLWDTKPPGFRELLVNYGTEVRRGDHPEYWVHRWSETAAKAPRVVAPDVRFDNEARAVLGVGGKLWRVERPGIGRDDRHPSELLMDSWQDWHQVVQNDGSLTALWGKVDLLARGMGLEPVEAR